MPQGIEDLVGDIEKARSQSEKDATQLSQAQSRLRESLAKGTHTTGDRLSDFLMRVYGTNVPKSVEETYRHISHKFSEGEKPVILVNSYQDLLVHRDPGPAHESDYGTFYHYDLGFLHRPVEFNVKEGCVVFPTGSSEKPLFAEHSGSSRSDWVIKEGPLTLTPYSIDPSLDASFSLIPRLFSLHHHFLGAFTEEELLSHKLPAGTHLSPIVYAEGLKLIGAPLSPPMREIYERYEGERVAEVSRTISHLVFTDLNPQKSRHNPLALQEIVRSAAKWGLLEEGKTIEPRPGVRIEIAPYLTSLCKEYDILLPGSETKA